MESKIFIVLLFLSSVIALEYFVDGKNGNDNNPGTQSQPFATIGKAQSTIRGLGGNIPAGGIQVQIRAGDYSYSSSPLTFTSADSGKSGAVITYTGYQNEKVRLLAGKIIPSSAFKPWKGSVYSVDLKSLGITSYGELASGSLGQCSQNQLEVFFNDQPMIIARYPNIDSEGHWVFDKISKVTGPNQFTYSGNRPSLWTNAPDLWLHGYWSFDWADSYVKVSSIDTTTSSFNINPSTPPVYGLQNNARYYALNLLEELDAPNEYYLDRTSGTLYFYPPSPLSPSDELVVSVGNNVVSLNADYLTFNNLGLYFSRITGFSINGNNIQVSNCDVSNHGVHCISFTGTNSVFDTNVIYGCGCTGINANGGVQKTLTPGSIVINNNQIHNYARIVRTYNPGVHIGGVGHVVKGNFIHDAPHNGILVGGGLNNCMFVGNHLKNLCFEATDSGAFYTGRSWIDRGNVFRQNIIENVYNTEPISLGWPSIQGVYLDDQMSGWVIDDNTFLNCQTGIVVGGGRRNNVTNNHFNNCTLAIHFDNRGMNWQNTTCAPGGQFEQQLKSVNYQQPPWSVAYPELVNIMSDHPCVPVYNNFVGNTYCATSSQKFIDASATEIQSWFSTASDNNPSCP